MTILYELHSIFESEQPACYTKNIPVDEWGGCQVGDIIMGDRWIILKRFTYGGVEYFDITFLSVGKFFIMSKDIYEKHKDVFKVWDERNVKWVDGTSEPCVKVEVDMRGE